MTSLAITPHNNILPSSFPAPLECLQFFLLSSRAQTKEDFSKINFKPRSCTQFIHSVFFCALCTAWDKEFLLEKVILLFVCCFIRVAATTTRLRNDIGSDTYGVIQRYIFCALLAIFLSCLLSLDIFLLFSSSSKMNLQLFTHVAIKLLA